MKPLGKAIKANLDSSESCQKALNKFLTSFRDTPHISTNVSPGDYLFRHGYRSEFPRNRPLDENQVTAARELDIKRKIEIQEVTNKSVKRKKTEVKIGDQVLLKDLTRRSKFDPIYHRKPYTVREVTNKGVTVTGPEGQCFRRHKDDLKLCAFSKEKEGERIKKHIEEQGNMLEVEMEGMRSNIRMEEDIEDNEEEDRQEMMNIQEGEPRGERVLERRSGRTRKAPNWQTDYEM